ncbi:MAG: hypothetical protein WC342_04860 [Methanoregula sp.]|jgi:uncharacterized coiled-coil protein SlyX
MVQPDAKIRYLEFELEEKERTIHMMESSGSGAVSEDRIAALEKKVNEMEALVKGLTQELLDLKSIAMKMSKQTEERSRQELKRMQPIAQTGQVPGATPGMIQHSSSVQQSVGSSTIIMRKGARSAEAESMAPTEPAMDMIMQSDGTMKLEPRRGDKDYIVASAGYGRNKKGGGNRPKQSELIYAVEEDKSNPSDSAKK